MLPQRIGEVAPGFVDRCGAIFQSISSDRKESAVQQPTYPIRLSVDYPDRDLDRTTTLLRIFVAIPILVVLGCVSGSTWQFSSGNGTTKAVAGAGGLLFPGPRLWSASGQRTPPCWFAGNSGRQRSSPRLAPTWR